LNRYTLTADRLATLRRQALRVIERYGDGGCVLSVSAEELLALTEAASLALTVPPAPETDGGGAEEGGRAP